MDMMPNSFAAALIASIGVLEATRIVWRTYSSVVPVILYKFLTTILPWFVIKAPWPRSYFRSGQVFIAEHSIVVKTILLLLIQQYQLSTTFAAQVYATLPASPSPWPRFLVRLPTD